VHARELDGRILRFGHSGWLWHNAYLLYDRETESVWHHQTGWAMSGPLRGKSLARFPTTLTTFEAWAQEHPDSHVLPKPPASRERLDADTYALRNAGLAFGLGVDLPGVFWLVPFRELAAAGDLVQEEIDGVPLVIVADPAARTAHAYSRRVDGQVVELVRETSDDGAGRLVDAGGGRAWSVRSGRSEASGVPDLRRLHAAHWETHAWVRQHPTGRRFRANRDGDAGVLPGGR